MKRRVFYQSDQHIDFLVGGQNTLKEEDFLSLTTNMLPQDDVSNDILVLAGDMWIGKRSLSWAGHSWLKHVAERFFHVVMVKGNHCVDSETEALTKRGWLRYDEIRVGDEVMTLETNTSTGEWNTVERVVVNHNHQGFYCVDSPSMNLALTPEHRVLVKAKYREFYTYAKAKDLPKNFTIPCCVKTKLPEMLGVQDDMLRLIGWLLSDGCFSGNSITIYQSKVGHDIEELLQSCEISYTHRVRTRNITHICGRKLVKPPLPEHSYRVQAESKGLIYEYLHSKKVVPEWVFELSERQFDILLGGIVSGNGVRNKTGDGFCIHGTKDFLESLQAVCITKGWRANISVARGKDYKLNICRRNTWSTFTGMDKSSMRESEGVSWCVTVKNGNFVSRRKGKVCVTGNCRWEGCLGDEEGFRTDMAELGITNVSLLENSVWEDLPTNTLFIGATLWTDVNSYSPLCMLNAPNVMASDFKYVRTKGYKRFRAEDWCNEHKKSVQYIDLVCKGNPSKNIVVVTHHAPSYSSVHHKYRGQSSNHYYASSLEWLMQDRENISHWIHGHTHDSFNYFVDKCNVLCNPYGYRGENIWFNPNAHFEIGE